MLKVSTIQIVTAYWANYFACPPASFLSRQLQLLPHGPELADYQGIFALSRNARTVISIPPGGHRFHATLSSVDQLVLPELPALLDLSHCPVVGPACIGYADSLPEMIGEAQPLHHQHASAVERLRAACKPGEWEHGGCDLSNAAAAFGVFFGEELISLASYEIWGGTIAHISVITRSSFRRSGHAHTAVASAAIHALNAGLIPQYRTLQSNLPSLRIAENLGFTQFASSLAIRFL